MNVAEISGSLFPKWTLISEIDVLLDSIRKCSYIPPHFLSVHSGRMLSNKQFARSSSGSSTPLPATIRDSHHNLLTPKYILASARLENRFSSYRDCCRKNCANCVVHGVAEIAQMWHLIKALSLITPLTHHTLMTIPTEATICNLLNRFCAPENGGETFVVRNSAGSCGIGERLC
jgi:hypothetical protein